MMDTLETAQSFGFSSAAVPRSVSLKQPFERLIGAWFELTVALNGMNRSMGLPDAYPFQIGPQAKTKLAFVHDLLNARSETSSVASALDPRAA
jgi:hypothetical protein